MKNCIVIIPIYKDVPTRSECASIRQTFRVLGRHDIVFVTHADCRLDAYREIVEAEQGTLRTELFDAGYFDSTAHYSDLCFSEEFYLRFKDYEYMPTTTSARLSTSLTTKSDSPTSSTASATAVSACAGLSTASVSSAPTSTGYFSSLASSPRYTGTVSFTTRNTQSTR